MSRYMIRKPEFMRGAEGAKYFPNTVIVILISLAIILAYFIVSLIVGMIYGAALIAREGAGYYKLLTSQGTIIFSLFFEAAFIVLTLIYISRIEKRGLSTIGLVKRAFPLRYAAGFGIGFVMLAVYSLPLFLNAPVYFTGITPLVIVYLGAFMVQSAAEEIFFRGYMMAALLRRGGALWAVTISTAVFALFHIPNSPLTICMVALLGAVLALYMLRTGSIWGAMGLHAAWNFTTGCIAPIDLGPFRIEYTMFESPAVYEEDPIYTVIAVIMFIAMISLLLFAGRNRLVVRKTQEQMLLGRALKLAKESITDRGQLSFARRISELTEGNGGKTAALLYYAISYGASTGYIRQAFGEDMLSAADSLTVRYGETPEDYWSRVLQYPAALSVKNAERRYEEILRPKYAAYGREVWVSGATQCPMLRWAITSDYCRHIRQGVDGMAAAYTGVPESETFWSNEGYIAKLDHGICRKCPARYAGLYRAASNRPEGFLE